MSDSTNSTSKGTCPMKYVPYIAAGVAVISAVAYYMRKGNGSNDKKQEKEETTKTDETQQQKQVPAPAVQEQKQESMDNKELRKITLDEICKHQTDGDMWVRYNGKVYDVSKYMEDHPGGKEPYFDHLGGKDATDAFDEADHTKAAIRLSETYCIGEFQE